MKTIEIIGKKVHMIRKNDFPQLRLAATPVSIKNYENQRTKFLLLQNNKRDIKFLIIGRKKTFQVMKRSEWEQLSIQRTCLWDTIFDVNTNNWESTYKKIFATRHATNKQISSTRLRDMCVTLIVCMSKTI